MAQTSFQFKKALTVSLQATVSLALIYWIFHDPQKRALMATALLHAQVGWFIPGLLCVGCGLILHACRWFFLLDAIEIGFPLKRCVQLMLIGTFFNLFLLGATGGDVVKAYYAMREKPDTKSAIFLSIVIDRMLGIVALSLVSTCVVLLRWPLLFSTPLTQGLMAALVLILGGSLCLLFTGWVLSFVNLKKPLPQRVPFRKVLSDFALAIRCYTQAPKFILKALSVSIVSHLCFFSAFFFAAKAFTQQLSLLDLFSVMPIVNTITALPISLSGIGLREELFERLLSTLYNIPAAQSVLISMSGYLMMVCWGLCGGIVYLTYRPGGKSLPSLKTMPSGFEP